MEGFEGVDHHDFERGSVEICALIFRKGANVFMKPGEGGNAFDGNDGVLILLGIVFMHVDLVEFNTMCSHFGADGRITFIIINHLVDDSAEFGGETQDF